MNSNLEAIEVWIGKVEGNTADKQLVSTSLPFSWDTRSLDKGVYVIEIKATDTWGEESYSSILVNVVLEAPELYTPKHNSIFFKDQLVLFDWGEVPGATKHKLTISHPLYGEVLSIQITNTQYYVDLSGFANGLYTWKVNAIDSDGVEGLDSEEWTFRKFAITKTLVSPYAINIWP
ncbi:MAG: hypothetical protein ABIH55_01390 [Nanoarchaeota archaeon]